MHPRDGLKGQRAPRVEEGAIFTMKACALFFRHGKTRKDTVWPGKKQCFPCSSVPKIISKVITYFTNEPKYFRQTSRHSRAFSSWCCMRLSTSLLNFAITPRVIRYAWKDNPLQANVRSLSGLPMSSFELTIGK